MKMGGIFPTLFLDFLQDFRGIVMVQDAQSTIYNILYFVTYVNTF